MATKRIAGTAKPRPRTSKLSREGSAAFGVDTRRRNAAEGILTEEMVLKGDWDAARVAKATMGKNAITSDDLALFRRNMGIAQKRFKGSGITARQVIDLASSNPLKYRTEQPRGAKSDIDKAKSEITTAYPVHHSAGTVRFVTNSGSHRGKHHVNVVLNAFPEALKQVANVAAEDNAASVRTAANFVRKGKLAFECDCERFTYFLRYLATIGGFVAGRKETGFPKMRNPELRGVACKHVLRVMAELESSGVVLGMLERAIKNTLRGVKRTVAKRSEQSAAKKKTTTVIKTTEQRRIEAVATQIRREVKKAASRPASGQKIAPATRKIQAEMKKSGMTATAMARIVLQELSR